MSMLLAVIIEVTSLCLAVPAGAVNKSSDEAVSWAVSKIGSKVGSGQCVALIYAYYEFLGVRPTGGNACDYVKKTPPEGFDTIQYYPGFVAKPGDIAVWTSTLVIKDGKKVKNTLGHIAIVESANSISMNLIDQNNSAGGRDSNKQVVGRFENQPYEPNNGYDTFWGVIRPDFNDFKCDLVQLGDDSYGIYGCSRNSGNVTIPDKIDGKTITAILDRTFKNCTSITGVSIPNTVTDIAYGAFESCSNLKSVSIPSSVKTIGPGAFSNCTSLTDVTIPDGVEKIDFSAFSGCTSLNSIFIPNSVTSIGNTVFDESPNVVIKCYSGSAAHKYAYRNSIPFVLQNFCFYKDIVSDSWYYNSVIFATDAGLFKGVSMDVFAPNMTMSRAMVVTVLWRLFGTPSIRINAKCTASDPALFASDGTSAEEKKRLTT